MFGKSRAALGLLLLVACHESAMAASDVEPYLPRCKPSHETRVPIRTWDDNHGKLASLRRLISTWPSGTALIVYASFGAAEDDVQIEGQDKAYSVKITFRGSGPEAGKVKISASEPPQFNVGFYLYRGFFEVDPPSSPNGEITLLRLDTFDVVSSGRYCLGNGSPPAPLHEIPAVQNTQSGGLPECRQSHETRIPIATWKPRLTPNDAGLFDVHLAPPTGNGRIVYISIEDPKHDCGPYASGAELYSVSLANPPTSSWPGVGINLRGNAQPAGSGCRFEGFYMNEPVYGMHQGWTETYFGAIDRERIVASNNYCMERKH